MKMVRNRYIHYVFIMFCALFLNLNDSYSAVTITQATGGGALCADVYTQLGDVIINEGANTDIAINQTNATLILSIPSGYVFNAGVGNITFLGGGDITGASLVVNTTTITVTFTTNGNPSVHDQITISGLEVKALVSSPLAPTGNIIRTSGNPGTGTIAGITNDVTNFGTNTQSGPMVYSSSSVSQIATLVNPSIINNQIIRIDVTTTGSCLPSNASSFTFNMSGTTSLSDIENAKLFYTGTTSTFTADLQLSSTVVSPAGSFDINGFSQALKSGTNYFWLAVDVVAGATINNVVDAQCTSVIVDGTSRTPSPISPAGSRIITALQLYTVGVSGYNYTSIQAAYNAVPASLTNSYLIELQSNYTDVNEPAGGLDFTQKTMNGFFITVRPALGVTARVVDFDPGLLIGMCRFNGADNVIFDGRPGGIGTSRELTIRNTRNIADVAPIITLNNDATGNIFRYLNIEGEVDGGPAGGGALLILSTSTQTTGNDNNTIEYCKLSDLTTGGSVRYPFAGVFSLGTAGKANDNNKVLNCEIIDVYRAGTLVFNNGFIVLRGNNNSWTIQNNHCYQTASYTGAGTNPFSFISIEDGTNHLISGNFLGGMAPYCGGSQFTISSGTNQVIGININGAGNNVINNNQFENFKYITSYNQTGSPLIGISLNGTGNFIIGSFGKANIIGKPSANGDIILTNNGTTGNGFAGIENNCTGTVNIAYNNIGGITVNGSMVGYTNSMISSSSASGSLTVNNNTIGGTISNSIAISSNSNFNGIYCSGASGISASNNIIQNINHTASTAVLNGIYNLTGPFICNGNTIKNITSSSGTIHRMIQHSGTTATINNNIINSLNTTGAAGALRIIDCNLTANSDVTIDGNTIGTSTPNGILITGNTDNWLISKGAFTGTGNFNVTNNVVQGITLSNGGAATELEGLLGGVGTFNCSGNTIKNIFINSTYTSDQAPIWCTSASLNNVISGNTIENIQFTNTTAVATWNEGMYLANGSGIVSNNFISQISNASTSATARVVGAYVSQMNYSLYNNVILIDNNGSTNSLLIYGLQCGDNSNTTTIYHNTVKIFGNQSGNTLSAASYRTGTGTYNVKNNIFQNLRTGGTSGHYAEYVNPNTGVYNSNNNYLETVDATKLCNAGGTNYSIAGWKGAPVNASNSVTGAATIDASGVVTSSPFDGAGKGTNLTATVPDDKNGVARSIASWMGAYEGLSILTSAISPTSICAGAAVSVSFTISGGGAFVGGNTFTAQLSDASGSFATPTNIGTLVSTTAGTINATIPGGTPNGNGYRIRVASSTPVIIGSDNLSNITISIASPGAFSVAAATGIGCTFLTANWGASTNAATYYLDVSKDGFVTFVPGFNNLNVGNILTYNVTGLMGATNYSYRLRAENGCGSISSSGTVSVNTTGTIQTYTVTSTVNGTTADGVSLRWAITQANANCGHDTIQFNLGGAGPYTIALTAILPDLTDNSGVTINGWENGTNDGAPNTIPVFSATAGTPLNPTYKVILGNGGTVATGLILGSNNNIIKGLVFPNFGDGSISPNDIAIKISGNFNQVSGCYVGMDVTGTTRGTKSGTGISITGKNNIIGDGTAKNANLVSGMNAAFFGVEIFGAAATNNSVKGNLIGLQKDGATTVTGATQGIGVYLYNSASSNTIGGSNPGEGNVISGNDDGFSTGDGIYLADVSGNSILGNIVGPKANGNSYVTGNLQAYGIYLLNASNNIFRDNTISANEILGVFVTGASSTGNSFKGNFIGIDKNGTTFISGSAQDIGIQLSTGTSNNIVGGFILGDGNVISGNNSGTSLGTGITLLNTTGNSITGNIIGPQTDGLTYVANNLQFCGIYINGTSTGNVIGGSSANERNIISANETWGIEMNNSSTTGDIIKGNFIGIAKNGSSFITGSTQDYGILMTSLCGSGNIIGGTGVGEGNVISGNKDASSTGRGIYINSTAAAGNTVIGNIIGPQSDGITYLASNAQSRGLEIDGSPNNTIGGNSIAARNIISANELYGIEIIGAAATGNSVKGNYIGIDKNGTSFITNSTQDMGVYILGSAANNIIGGTGLNEGNVISGNKSAASNGIGISLSSTAAAGNSVLGNIIGPQADAITYLASNAQYYGISISGSPNNIIGGNTPGSRNIISANETNGIYIGTAAATGNSVKGNYIGIDKNGTSLITGSNQDIGISIESSAANNAIGGTGVDEGNLISGNSSAGVYLNSSAVGGNSVLGNIIGPQKDGSTYLNSNGQLYGVEIINSLNNSIGGSTVGARNIISANESVGVYILGALGCTGNVIKGNYIGIDKAGTSIITGSTQNTGVWVANPVGANTIGGIAVGEGNVISGNSDGVSAGKGIYLGSSNAGGTSVFRNIIGLQADSLTYLASNDQAYGVYISGSPNNIIGGNTAGHRNVISANLTAGIQLMGAASTGNVLKGNYIGPNAALADITGSNQDYGVNIINGASSNTIGAVSAGDNNVIAYNSTEGVFVYNLTSTANKVSSNLIYDNLGKAININYGVNQANNGKAVPIITAAITTLISGTSVANDIVEVFKNTSGISQNAETFVGSTTADGAGNWSLVVSLTSSDYVHATARDAGNNTSEFTALTPLGAGSITTSSITPTLLCRGGSITVNYTLTGLFNAGNVFTAELSDASGSFTTPVSIGNVTATTNTPISAAIPLGSATGSAYRIRVTSSNPSLNGTDNASNLTISANGGVGTWTWIGNSNNWFDACNWDKKCLPDALSDVIIPGGTPNNPTITGATADCKTINIVTTNSAHLNIISTSSGHLNVAQ